MRVGVIYNGYRGRKVSPEQEAVRQTGKALGERLELMGYEITYYDVDNPKDIERLSKKDIDLAFNAYDTVNDDPQGGAYIPALLELLGIPHTSLSSSLIALSNHKPTFKSILNRHNIPTPGFQAFSSPDDPVGADLNYPLAVSGALSDDAAVVHNEAELRLRVEHTIETLNQDAVAEEIIEGREFCVPVIDGKILDITEPDNHSSQGVQVAGLSKKDRRTLEKIALECYDLLGFDSYVRFNIVLKEGKPYVIEVDTSPTITAPDANSVEDPYALYCTKMIDMILSSRSQ